MTDETKITLNFLVAGAVAILVVLSANTSFSEILLELLKAS
ncbi:MAG: hypothetical protein ACRECW_15305 [Phyllobacterium sp.]